MNGILVDRPTMDVLFAIYLFSTGSAGRFECTKIAYGGEKGIKLLVS